MLVELGLFEKGFLIGLAVALPIGPLNIICITRVLKEGFKGGLPVMLGTSLADATYAMIAVFGLTIVSDFLIAEQFWFRTIGGLVLLYLGVKTFKNKPHVTSGNEKPKAAFIKDVGIIYSITLSSPLTVMTFAAIFAGLGMDMFKQDGLDGMLLVAGVMSGTFSWMLTLTIISAAVRQKLDDSFLLKLNFVGGIVLIIFAMIILVGF